jgi:hypothetical protein
MIFTFLSGSIMMGFFACGLFFLRFWKTTKDSLFLWFALGFWMLSAERWVLVLVEPDNEFRPYVYGFRLVAFVMIILGIVEKNRGAQRR